LKQDYLARIIAAMHEISRNRQAVAKHPIDQRPSVPDHPFTEAHIGHTELKANYRVDLRQTTLPDVFYQAEPISDWSELTWAKIGKPYRVERWSSEKLNWEREHDQTLPPKTSWEMFNRSFQGLINTEVESASEAAKAALGEAARHFDIKAIYGALDEIIHLALWDKIYRVEDGILDPRGKRALFGGLDLNKPEILFLGAADGYEAMQLCALYPGAHAVLVDYDEYCRDNRFGAFPEAYPFLGVNPATGTPKVWYRDEMNIDYEIEDIRNLKYGKEFDLVISVGLIEHFPDDYKPLVMDMHRRFLKPGGIAILTTPRLQLRSRLFYMYFAEIMNFAYRELMDVAHLGLYAYENGFEILRHGRIKVHNGIVVRPR
jgi:SAM-dependent methyltransferase